MQRDIAVKHLHIVGLVQGVGYRASFEAKARALKLSGWVRNRHDGSVEALLSGNGAALDSIIAWARHGPPSACVDQVTVSDVDDALIEHDSFKVLPTQ